MMDNREVFDPAPTPAHCAACGRTTDVCAGCGRELDPPRFCPACGRRMAVTVTPGGYVARCLDHGVAGRG